MWLVPKWYGAKLGMVIAAMTDDKDDYNTLIII